MSRRFAASITRNNALTLCVLIAAFSGAGLAFPGGSDSKPAFQSEATGELACLPGPLDPNYKLPAAPSQVVTSETQVGTSWAGHQVQQDIVTHGTDQYVGYYDSARRLTLAHRTINETTWRTFAIPGNEAVTGWDSHDSIALAVDQSGELHVAGNMHDSPLAYWVTTIPGVLTSLVRVPVLVERTIETQVTYPQFLQDANGNLVFSYRQGLSGDANTYLDKYDPSIDRFSPLLDTPLFNGQASLPTLSAYSNISAAPNARGYFELTWVWRRTGDVATNSRLSYMRSRDLIHWETVAGTPVSLPVKFDTPGVVVDDFPENSGAVNGLERLGIDAQGDTTITYSKYDASGSNQIYVAHVNGAGQWESAQVTYWAGRWDVSGFGSLVGVVSFQGTEQLTDGNMGLAFHCRGKPDSSGTLILSGASYDPIAQLPYAPSDVPSQVTRLEGTMPATQVHLVHDRVGSRDYILKWQSQGSNQDQPFGDVPPAQPLEVFTVTSQPAVGLTPPELPHQTTRTLDWFLPALVALAIVASLSALVVVLRIRLGR